MDHKTLMMLWINKFEEISTKKFDHALILQVTPTYSPMHPITIKENVAALKCKSENATVLDDVAVELWRSRYWNVLNDSSSNTSLCRRRWQRNNFKKSEYVTIEVKESTTT